MGEVLTATIGTIADDTDGLPTGTFPTGYTFAWVRVDASNTETAIGTNSSSYTPVAADVGATIRVTVSFTDAAGQQRDPDQRRDGRGDGPRHHRADRDLDHAPEPDEFPDP